VLVGVIGIIIVRCDTEIRTETIARVDFSQRPFKVYTEAMVSDLTDGKKVDPILAKSVIISTVC
jgi:hypothetical protein